VKIASATERLFQRVDADKVNSATSLGMMTDEEKRLQRIEDIKELLS
jgi:hypothetical protein